MTVPQDRPAETSIGQLISDISDDLSRLFRQEVELAKAEVRQEATKAGKAAGMLGGAKQVFVGDEDGGHRGLLD